MIAVHFHCDSEAPEAPQWSRERHFGRCGQSCCCCREENGEDFGACLACGMAKEVEHIFKNIKDYLGPVIPGANTMSGKLVAKMLPRHPEEPQQLVLSYNMAAWRATLQAAGCVCMPLVRKMKEDFLDSLYYDSL